MAQVILTPVRDFASIRNRAGISGAKLGELKTPTEYTLVGTVEGGNYTAPNNTTHNTWFSLINAANQPVFIATEFVSMQIVDEPPDEPAPRRVFFDLIITSAEDLATLEKALNLLEYVVSAIRAEVENEKANPDYADSEDTGNA